MYTYMIILRARITQYFIVFALSPIPCKQAATEAVTGTGLWAGSAPLTR